MGDDLRNQVWQPIYDAQAAVEGMFAKSEAYQLLRGDIMLQLHVKNSGNSELRMGLELRKRAVFNDYGETTDIADVSGIDIPEDQEIAVMPGSGLEEALKNPENVGFRRSFAVGRQDLADALCRLYSTIRGYESMPILHEAGYTDAGYGRNAVVSVTGMGLLREFDIPELQNLPDIYHSTESNPGVIHLPRESKVAFLPVRRK